MASILVVSGSPGTGKTTVAAHLAKASARGLHIPSDVFYEFPAHPISPYRPESRAQNVDMTVALTRTAATFASRGWDVFLDGIFGPWFLPTVAAELEAAKVGADYVVLRAPLDVVLRRVRDRIGSDDRDHVVRQMHAALADLGPYETHVVDTGADAADRIAAEVARRRAAGALALDLAAAQRTP